MKKFLKIFLAVCLLILIGAFVLRSQSKFSLQVPTLANLKNNIDSIFAPAPCSTPIPYTLGTFDTQFGISQADFLTALTEAQAIWEKPQGDYLGKELFTYVPNDSDPNALKINLVYDYRQQATSKLASLGIVVGNDQSSYDALKTQFTNLESTYNTEKSSFNTEVTDFNQKQDAYEAEVNSWNQKGGAPQADYDRLQATQVELKNESAQLQVTQSNLNNMIDEINAMVVVLNRLVATLNLSVDQYNSVNGTLGESFEEGVYVEDGASRHIDIYEYSNHDKLVRVLAHELGHALGMQHVTDPNAIMYKFNQSTSLALSQADINELKTVCEIK